MKEPDEQRDPERDKARDLKRQRKISNSGSDKSARKAAPRIKAMANRQLRRKDRAELSAFVDQPEDDDRILPDLAQAHRDKPCHWGSELAADHRNRREALMRDYQAAGGRAQMMIDRFSALLATETDPMSRKMWQNNLDWYLSRRRTPQNTERGS
ncbi:MAG: hypothetical protein EA339_07435 [Rhodobacteraceae bacterium]|nr:MAG: hypothetical protein EA339_07435 [Paracoccaceae bacterium]